MSFWHSFFMAWRNCTCSILVKLYLNTIVSSPTLPVHYNQRDTLRMHSVQNNSSFSQWLLVKGGLHLARSSFPFLSATLLEHNYVSKTIPLSMSAWNTFPPLPMQEILPSIPSYLLMHFSLCPIPSHRPNLAPIYLPPD